MADFSAALAAVRAAVEMAKPLAETFQTGVAKFYVTGNETPVLETTCRVKKPRPSAFDGGNQTEWGTKRVVNIRVPQNALTGVIEKGWILQVSTPDGDPTINQINFIVQSSLSSQFSAERDIVAATEVNATPRIS